MSLSEHLVAAPAAFVRASARSDEVDRAFAVRIAPGLHVAVDVDRLSRRPGLAIEIGDLCALRRLVHFPLGIEVSDAGNGSRDRSRIQHEMIRVIPQP